jgi:hypothetical protein
VESLKAAPTSEITKKLILDLKIVGVIDLYSGLSYFTSKPCKIYLSDGI